MTLASRLGLSDARERLLVRAMQAVLVGLLGYGLVTGQWGMAANGGFALFVTLLPALIRREYGYSMDAGLVLWITVAVVLHSLGVLGPYKRFPWYDAVAHTVTATIIAGVGYASLRAFETHSEAIRIPSEFRAVFIVVFVLAAGVVWELLEFASGGLASITGGRAALVVRGIDDIVSDMVFNALGAVIVALWESHRFDGLVGFFSGLLRSRSDRG